MPTDWVILNIDRYWYLDSVVPTCAPPNTFSEDMFPSYEN